MPAMEARRGFGDVAWFFVGAYALAWIVGLVRPGVARWILAAGVLAHLIATTWRGLMIASSRHFMPIAMVKRNLDGMAAVKLNVLHWHLVDDQGFRVETTSMPRLHELGSDGLYYTRTQIREIIDYAADRGIRVCGPTGDEVEADLVRRGRTVSVARGSLSQSGKERLVVTAALGELDGSLSPRLQRIGEAFTDAGFPVDLSTDIVAMMWEKLFVNVATGAWSALTGLPYGELSVHADVERMAIATVASSRWLAWNGPPIHRSIRPAHPGMWTRPRSRQMALPISP